MAEKNEAEPVVLRPARFDKADAESLARALDIAADGVFASLFGSPSHKILAEVALAPEHSLSLQFATIAEQGGETLGVLQGLPSEAISSPDKHLTKAAGWRILRAGLISLLGSSLFRALDTHSPGDWYLQAVAVFPEHRGKGIGSQLIRSAIDKSIASDSQRLTLDVDSKNTNAIALYQRLGMRITRTTTPAYFLGGVQLHRMTLPLEKI